MSTDATPDENRSTERGTGLRGNQLVNFSVTNLWNIEVEMPNRNLGERSRWKIQILEAFTPRW